MCEVGFSGPRKGLHVSSVLDSLSLDGQIILRSSRKFKFLTQALLNYLLQVSTKTTGIESLQIYRATVSLIGSLYFSFYYKCLVRLTLSRGTGFHNLRKYKTNQMIIGYFQSYRYLENDHKLSFFKILSLRETGSDWDYWSLRALQEKPLIVHIRLGDYLQENGFGIITTSYISESLSRLESVFDGRPIWVFSDQEKLAAEILPSEFLSRVIWVPEIDSNPMATLSIMRLGSGYVIANSTFSWWAAWSKQNLEAPVFCPQPWFARVDSPKELIPAHWIKIDTNHKEDK